MNKLMTTIAAVAMTITGFAQPDCGNGMNGEIGGNNCWEETENWMSASKRITPNQIDKSFIFDLTADAEQVLTSDNAMMVVTACEDADVANWMTEMEEGLFESGNTYFNLSSQVKALDGMGYSAYYHGQMAGQPMMMQKFLFIGEDGNAYEAQVFAQSFEEWNTGLNSTSYFIASMMEACSPDYAYAYAN